MNKMKLETTTVIGGKAVKHIASPHEHIHVYEEIEDYGGMYTLYYVSDKTNDVLFVQCITAHGDDMAHAEYEFKRRII